MNNMTFRDESVKVRKERARLEDALERGRVRRHRLTQHQEIDIASVAVALPLYKARCLDCPWTWASDSDRTILLPAKLNARAHQRYHDHETEVLYDMKDVPVDRFRRSRRPDEEDR